MALTLTICVGNGLGLFSLPYRLRPLPVRGSISLSRIPGGTCQNTLPILSLEPQNHRLEYRVGFQLLHGGGAIVFRFWGTKRGISRSVFIPREGLRIDLGALE